ncbi:MAG TPA: translation initiation factor IF-6 [archaeon]|nr:translation initiation factor IF-6 [archaeon]
MNFSRGTVKSSPYIGVFCTVTDDIALVPKSITQKELSEIEKTLDVSALRCEIGNSGLVGILAKGLGRKFAISALAEKEEKKALEKEGLEVHTIMHGFTSTGNLIALNENGGIASPLLAQREIDDLNAFFGVRFSTVKIDDNDICGASTTVTNKGFICHPNISEKGFSELEKIFSVKGMPTTANFGDMFVGNSVLANSKGVMAGLNTSGIELSKIDQGLRGD